ncbi:MAG: hypothetical protein AAF813_11450 [Pseudomonadota bacterium]
MKRIGPGPGIGHNSRTVGTSWRRYCWTRARSDLIGQRLPLEVLRRRVRRARELGLAYPQYASILLGSGRDILGFLYTCDAIGLRLRRRLELPEASRAALAGLVGCERLIVAPREEPTETFRLELQEVSGLEFAASAHPPDLTRGWAAARRSIRSVLEPIRLPTDSVVLVGTEAAHAHWAEAVNFARCLPPEAVFGQAPGDQPGGASSK